MDTGKVVVALVFLIFGGINAFKPDLYINFQKRIFKTIYGAVFTPSAKTVKINRIFGIIFGITGLLLLLS